MISLFPNMAKETRGITSAGRTYPNRKNRKTNIVVVRNLLQRQERRRGEMRRDSYVIDVNRERNCYSCGGFGYLVQNCKRQGTVDQEKKIEYKNNQNTMNNLNREENLIILNQVLVVIDLQCSVEQQKIYLVAIQRIRTS